jgi:nitrogen fixation protein FixH
VLPAKLYYLKQLENGPVSHRTITKRMTGKYLDSAAGIKDALVADGIIVCVAKVMQSNGKYAYHHKLTEKTYVAKKQQENSDAWDDGQAKSKGNAFNWRGPSVVFKKQELAQLQQKYQGNNPITIYSRA